MHNVPLALEDQSVSCAIDNKGHWPELKLQEREVDYSLPYSADVKNCVELYLHCLLCFREVIMNYAQTPTSVAA